MPLKKVLMIDDEELILLTTKLLLQQHNIETIATSRSQEGIELARTTAPDFILLDIMMPDMNGWEVLRSLQECESVRSIPVVIFTAGDFTATEEELRNRGVAGILRKPFHLRELLRILGIDNKEAKHA
jgi:two-component system, OmpR family, alkaline phosphatase synthesis response regulator PhoP